MAGTATNVFGGPVEVFVGPFGATEPTTAGGALDVAFKSVGFTSGGVKQNVNVEYTVYEVDQVPQPVGRRIKSRAVTVATTLAEATLENLALAMAQAASTVTTTAGGSEFEPAADSLTSEPEYSAVILRGPGPNGRTRDVIYRKCLPVEAVSTENSKTDQTGVPVTWAAEYVSASVRYMKVLETADAP